MRKERPFLAAFKSEIYSQEVTPNVKGKNQQKSNDIGDKKCNENVPSVCGRYPNKKTMKVRKFCANLIRYQLQYTITKHLKKRNI